MTVQLGAVIVLGLEIKLQYQWLLKEDGNPIVTLVQLEIRSSQNTKTSQVSQPFLVVTVTTLENSFF